MRKATTKTNDKVSRTFAIDGNLAKKIKIEAINTDISQSALFEDVMLKQFEKIYEERRRKYEEMKAVKRLENAKKFRVVSSRKRRYDYERRQINVHVDVALLDKWSEIKKVYGSNMTYYIETLIRKDIDQNFNEYKRLAAIK